MSLDTRKYAETHEWALAEGDKVTVGISEHAVAELRDITYVELPSVGESTVQGDPFGEVESIKTVAELNSPCDGEVVEVNDAVIDDPMVLSKDPLGEGWLIKIQASDPEQVDMLMTHDEYDSFVEDQAEEADDEDEEEFIDRENDDDP